VHAAVPSPAVAHGAGTIAADTKVNPIAVAPTTTKGLTARTTPAAIKNIGRFTGDHPSTSPML
jgi:hypothetical protein